jgi:hypothetical protein
MEHSIKVCVKTLKFYSAAWGLAFRFKDGSILLAATILDARRQKNTEIIWDDGYLASSIVAASSIEPSLNLNAKPQAAE